MSDAENERPTPARPRWVGIATALAVVVVVFGFVMPSFADYGDVWDTLTDMTWLEIGTLAGLAVFNLWTYLPLLTAALPGLRQRQAFVVNNSSTAVSNTLPGGSAIAVGVTYSMYRSWGFSNTAIGLSVVVTGIWNTFLKLGLPVVALAFLAISGEANASLVGASLFGVAVLAVAVTGFATVLRSERLAGRIGDAAARVASRVLGVVKRRPVTGWGQRLVGFRSSVIELVARRWARITLATLVSHITLYFLLLMALRHVGVAPEDVSWATVLAAFAFGRLITAIPVTPGGLGVIELGYVAALSVGVGGVTETRIVAAVLLFRALTFLPPILIGGFTYLVWQRASSWRRPQLREPFEPPIEVAR